MVVEVKRQVKLITEQKNSGKPAEMEGFPMKIWFIEVKLLNDAGNEMEANIFSKAVYHLHPSFANPVQTFEDAPFRCENDGWGEFDMTIDLHGQEKGGKHTIGHDLNFAKPRYEALHTLTFKNPNAALMALLRHSGPVPGDETSSAAAAAAATAGGAAGGGGGGINGSGAGSGRKKEAGGAGGGGAGGKKKKTAVDMDKLAEALVRLQEDDLLQVVQLIHDNKSEDTYTRNDVDQGEFHVDLYTLPDHLVRMLWDFVQQR